MIFRLMREELMSAEEASAKHIIRFKTEQHYRNWLKQFNKWKRELPRLSRLRPLPIINGFACTLRSPEMLMELEEVFSIEEDRKSASVHGFAGYPVWSSLPPPAKLPKEKPVIPWGISQIRAPQAWKRSTGAKVKVGVIDTGIDFSHPDLQHSIGGGINLIHRHMPPIDENGHGTHISGTIAAAASRRGIKGVSPEALIYAVKAFDHNGTSFVSDIIRGMEWCVRNRINIINMSFGMKTRSTALEAAVLGAFNAGVIIVASSGNEGRKGFVDYPARFPQTIAVGATSKDKKIAPFSNKGRQIDIYAPGEKIYSTWLHGRYNELSGTSMATSHVSGTIALLLSIKPRLDLRQIKSLLQSNASPITSNAKKSGFLGEVNAYRTVRALGRGKTPKI